MARFDLVLRGGQVIDGTGAAAIGADVAVAGDRIAAIGRLPPGSGRQEIDVAGLAVAPGFIDVHTHDDRALLSQGEMTPKVSQGVTTVIAGNCGVSLAPMQPNRPLPPPLDLIGSAEQFRFHRFADYMAALDTTPAATNAALLVGHSTLRANAMDQLERPASESEIEVMRARLAEALEAGAIGLSSGLWYAPAIAAPPSELAALAKTLHPAGAIYTTHMRDEQSRVLDSLEESFAVGREAEVPVVISHHKVAGKQNFGLTQKTLPKIAAAMARQPVGLDAYPYIASSTVLRADYIPAALKILITWSKSHPEATGRELAAIAQDWGVSQEEACERLQPGGAIYFTMDEADVRRVLAFEHTMIGSDGLPHDAHPHPRLWGTFARVLGHYCREEKLFPLEEAVRRMTGLPAQRFGLTGRGRLAPGAYADITVFDPAEIIDRATFAAPTAPAAGIHLVLVNGTPVWREGAATGARPGRALRRQQMQRERHAAG
ncbi:MAG TPA: D-aminoacylase [Stellaceae bacterium]|nr:D-aminoacylase [Stellaceae bacterium]